jgi:hypothetical protein
MLRHDPAAGHGPRFPLDRNDPVDQHERFIRQTHPGRKGVGFGKSRAKHPGHRTAGEFEAHSTVEDDVLYSLSPRERPVLSEVEGVAEGRVRGRYIFGHSSQRRHERCLKSQGVRHGTGEPFGSTQVRLMGLETRFLGRREAADDWIDDFNSPSTPFDFAQGPPLRDHAQGRRQGRGNWGQLLPA